MRRLTLSTSAALVGVIVILVVAVRVEAQPSSPVPSTGECSWQTNGQEVEIDGVRYQCHCERVAATREIWCTLVRVDAAARRVKLQRRHARLIPAIITYRVVPA